MDNIEKAIDAVRGDTLHLTHVWGAIPDLLYSTQRNSNESLFAFLNRAYAHGGGWRDFNSYYSQKWLFDPDTRFLRWTGERRIMKPLAYGDNSVFSGLRPGEELVLYPSAIIVARAGDEWQVSRMD